jgi:two-component system, OmpR family, phosphate regulon response regulator PhoB
MIAILCLEDEPEVRDAIVRDLRPFANHFRIETASDTSDAAAVLGELAKDGDPLGLILCDHRLPGETGVEFLTHIHHTPEFQATRKVLLTGQAGHQDTIRAINEGGLNRYLTKPWDPAELVGVVKSELTKYVVQSGMDPLPYLSVLEPEPLLECIGKRGGAE